MNQNQPKIFCRFRALIEKFPSWKEKGHKPSRAELKKVQLEPWLEPAWLGLITSNYINIFQKIEIQTIILSYLVSQNLNWVQIYDII